MRNRSSHTVKAAKARLDRFQSVRDYQLAYSGPKHGRIARRAGVAKVHRRSL